ncbi:MAG: enoyl-CoA hydratase/isomerase family protein [Oceanospirillaceae bacterium]|nr:enoyl-CoA hydratase/isomerase family protein [Oceanospirillaceae bacterium]
MIYDVKDGPLLVNTYATAIGQQIVEVVLNSPEALNALNGDMVDLLLEYVPAWEADDNVIAIVMRGAGNKAFCAGGDIRQLYREIAAGNQHVGEVFFNHEYEMDLMLHNLVTPLIVWGNGYVIGGGMGLLQSAAIRIGTQSSRLAMPEVTIGLFPDVGASYFLRQVPDHLGLFLGLTGAMLNGTDGRQLGLLDGLLNDDHYQKLMQCLLAMPSQSHEETLVHLKDKVLKLEASTSETPESNLDHHRAEIISALKQVDLADIISSLSNLKGTSKWLDKAIATMEQGSPTSLHLYHRLFQANFTNVEQALLQEYIIGVNATRLGEFKEGVRALLIDKDRNPNWRYKSVEITPKNWINQFFSTQDVAPANFS